METTSAPVSPTSVGLRYGLLTGLVSVIFSFILLVTHTDQSPAQWLGLLIFVGAMVLAHQAFRRENGGFMNYSQGLGIGTILGGISGILSTVFRYVYITFIDTEYLSRTMELARAKMEEKGGLTDEQIDQFISSMQKFNSGIFMVISWIIVSILFGFLIALVVSAITKHSRPEFE